MNTEEAVGILRKWDLGLITSRRSICNNIADLLAAKDAECKAARLSEETSSGGHPTGVHVRAFNAWQAARRRCDKLESKR
jgi:hypothetical protein